MKFCKDCAHYSSPIPWIFRKLLDNYSTCLRTAKPAVYTVDLVSGNSVVTSPKSVRKCWEERLDYSQSNPCGTAGIYFAEKSALRSTPTKEAE